MRLKTPALAAAMTLALGAAACGDDEQEARSSASGGDMAMSHSSGQHTAAGASTPAADLRAGLTALLTEHVDLAGIAISTGLDKGLDSKAFTASAATLDDNSKALAKAIGSVYGAEAEAQFLKTWRQHIGFFVDYARARATDDAAGMREARSDLDGYRQQFGAFLAEANPSLSPKAVADELKPHVASLVAVIDAAAKGSPTTYEKLREASAHMPMTAAVLAGAIDEQKKLKGGADAGASELRAGLTHLLTDHVYYAGIAVATKFDEAAVATLDENTQELARAIGSVYGDEAAAQFRKIWRGHIGFFVDYAKAQRSGDRQAARAAIEDLDGYRAQFGAFLAKANPNLTQQAVADELKPHVETLAAAIRAAVKGSPSTYDRLREAAGHMPMTAQVLADAIAKQKPETFPAT